MAIINIETATKICSVAIAEKGQVVFEKSKFDGPSHASLLGVFVKEAVDALKLQGLSIDAIAVSSGPGSYTGLRIGVSMAKGLCFGWNVPLISVPTLDILASKVIRMIAGNRVEYKPVPSEISDDLYCAMLDARRMEVYAAVYDGSLCKIRDTEAVIVTDDVYIPLLEHHTVYFFGDGAEKCKDIIRSPRAVFIDAVHPLAGEMASLSEQAYIEKRFENVAYFEPFYLKEFVATIAKNKMLLEN